MNRYQVLPQDQIDILVKVMLRIINVSNTTIGEIKQRYGLTPDEYEMAMQLCMPIIRAKNISHYWEGRFASVEQRLSLLIAKRMDPISKAIRKAIEEINAKDDSEYGNDFWKYCYLELERRCLMITEGKTDKVSKEVRHIFDETKIGIDHSLEKERHDQAV